jgi:pyruvate formate lyase activating enzyme
MNIAGFQPLSLIDFPGVISSIVFTQGCPFRCAYCHNPELIPVTTVHEEATVVVGKIKEETVFDHLKKHHHLIEGIVITGGEPTIHPDLPEFIQRVKRLGFKVKLDTNGVNPRMIQKLIDQKLADFFAMDLKHLWEKYADVIGIENNTVIENCRETFHLIQESPIRHEFRTTVYAAYHTPETLLAISDQLKDGEHYALQQVRYEKTRDTAIRKLPKLNLEAAAERIRSAHPSLHIDVRV